MLKSAFPRFADRVELKLPPLKPNVKCDGDDAFGSFRLLSLKKEIEHLCAREQDNLF